MVETNCAVGRMQRKRLCLLLPTILTFLSFIYCQVAAAGIDTGNSCSRLRHEYEHHQAHAETHMLPQLQHFERYHQDAISELNKHKETELSGMNEVCESG